MLLPPPGNASVAAVSSAGADDLHERVADGDYACHDAGDAACR